MDETNIYIPIVFDYEFYLEIYQDLITENITTRSDAMLHYMTIGKKEGRFCSYIEMLNKYGKEIEDKFDHEFYLKTYNDLDQTGIISRRDAIIHYMTIGHKEGRFYSYDDMLTKYYTVNGIKLEEIFDHEFYLKTYTDLGEQGIISRRDTIIHYIQSGYKECRAYSAENMLNQYDSNLQKSQNELNQFKQLFNHEFRILIRTSNRPEYFKRCIESILQQTYSHYHIYVCYDNDKSLEYLNDYNNNPKITYFPVYVESEAKYKFNLYCNLLMDRIEDGYIMFLDDDDMMVDPIILEVLNHEMSSNQIIVWRFLRPDKVIFPSDLDNELVLGEIDTASVCFHSSLKNTSQWNDKQYGDYHFYKKLLAECPRNRQMMINYTLTQTQSNDKIGNYGN